MDCQFHERQYELAFNLEIAKSTWRLYAPTPVHEKVLGFDVACAPFDPNVWGMLGVPRPSGVGASAGAIPGWSAVGHSLPFLAALFLQFKRPEWMRAANAKEWKQREALGAIGGPYFRFAVSARQHDVLRDLAQTVGAGALVRYAVPAFWEFPELWANQQVGSVIANSMFFDPLKMPSGEHTWTARGVGDSGIGFSEPREAGGESARDVGVQLRREGTSRGRRDGREFVHDLVSAAREFREVRRPRIEWDRDWLEAPRTRPELERRVDALELPDEYKGLAADLLEVEEVAREADASVLLLASTE